MGGGSKQLTSSECECLKAALLILMRICEANRQDHGSDSRSEVSPAGRQNRDSPDGEDAREGGSGDADNERGGSRVSDVKRFIKRNAPAGRRAGRKRRF